VAVTARPGLPLALTAGALALAGGAWLLWPRAAPAPAPASEVAGPATPASSTVPDRAAAVPPAASVGVASAASVLPLAGSPVVPAPAKQAIVATATTRPTESPAKPPRTAAPAAPEDRAVMPASRPAARPAFAGPAAATNILATAPASAASAAVVMALAPPAAPAPVAAPAAIDPMAAVNEALRRGDDAGAYRLARPLGDLGHPRALELLGKMAEEGRGTAQSVLQAYIWYSLAAQRGQASARSAAELVARRLQPAEIAQADRLVQNWRPQ
jgi:TPR repeat protein